MTPPHVLTPKAGAALFALRRRAAALATRGASFLAAFALAFSTVVFVLASGIFGAAILFETAKQPESFFHGGLLCLLAATVAGLLSGAAIALSHQLRLDEISFFAALKSRFWEPEFWRAVIYAKRILPQGMGERADDAMKKLGQVMHGAAPFGPPQAKAVALALPALPLAGLCAAGFVANAAIANAMFLACAAAESIKAGFASPNAAQAGWGQTGSGSTAPASRPSFCQRLAARVSRSIDSLAQEGGEELARRERAALAREIGAEKPAPRPKASVSGANASAKNNESQARRL